MAQGLTARCRPILPRGATTQELESVISKDVEALSRLHELNTSELDVLASNYESVFLTADSFDCARSACGCVIELTSEVVCGHLRNGIALVRPPGHHADHVDGCCGFCIINNVVAAARAAQRQGVERVMIVDWDIHHGNGTQRLLEDDPSVLYFSCHRYDDASFFPGSKYAAPESVGCGAGRGFSVNVAWNCQWDDTIGMGDDEYLAVWQTLLLPIARDFRPQLILVSAGFDSALGDAGGAAVTAAGYAQLTAMLQSVSDRVVLVLEGGYTLSVTARCVAACTAALLGDVTRWRQEVRPKREARFSIARTERAHAPYWPSLNTQAPFDVQSTDPVCLTQTADRQLESGPTSEGPGSHANAGDIGRGRKPAPARGKASSKGRIAGMPVAVRNTAESIWKSEMKKLEREQAELRNVIQRIAELKRRQACRAKLSR